MSRKYRLVLLAFLVAVLGVGSTVGYLAVTREISREITAQDENAILAIFQRAGINPINLLAERKPDFNAQVLAIRAIKGAVMPAGPDTGVIPANRARILDKAYRFLGYESRYASVFEAADTSSALSAVLRSGTKTGRSHAVLEVKTDKGWMLVDTLPPFVAVTKDNDPVSLRRLQDEVANGTPIIWQEDVGQPYTLLQKKFVIVYGLYAWRGFASFPDINWPEFDLNFGDDIAEAQP